ncbi:wnt inhibitory factor 1-like isoform X2 [Liolophura sinensis]|uniref:wnt inhibitory factor 1-like isoform X2 n=1 Tax=Liolophura sinensis TaxID=3198878 RepID=UPI003158D393
MFTGLPMEIFIIRDGGVAPYLSDPDFDRHIPGIPPQVDTVNLTWEAGEDVFTYFFDGLKSLDQNVLYNPLLSIPASGLIPSKTTVFQMAIPCTGNKEGVASLILGLQIFDYEGRPIKGSPIKLKLRKQCREFVTTSLCRHECQNGGRCNQFGDCECKQGFNGKSCETAMCYPSCQNNGTCISPDYCMCPDGFSGKRCETALCAEPCQNGGRCIEADFCWCTSGFYGEVCQYSRCPKPCENNGVCVAFDKCHCPQGYTGQQCEKTACRKPCANGVCVDAGVCKCDAGWRGRYCHKQKRNFHRPRKPRSQHSRRKPRRRPKRPKAKKKRGRKNRKGGRKNKSLLEIITDFDKRRDHKRRKARQRTKH